MTTNSTPHASIKPAFTVTSRLGETEATSSIVLVFPFFGRESRILFSMETITTLVENLKIIINRKRVGGIQMFTDQDEFLYLSKSNERIRIQLNRESNGGDYAQELIEVTTLPVSMVPEMLLAIRQEIGCVLRNFYTDEEDKEESFWANHNAFLQKENERLNKTAIENKKWDGTLMSKTSFTYEHGGRTHSGSHEISSGMIFVTTEFGQKKTQLGNLRAETLAGMLARELAREAS